MGVLKRLLEMLDLDGDDRRERHRDDRDVDLRRGRDDDRDDDDRDDDDRTERSGRRSRRDGGLDDLFDV